MQATSITADNINYIPQLNLSQSNQISSIVIKANETNAYSKPSNDSKNIDELNNRILYRFGRHRRKG